MPNAALLLLLHDVERPVVDGSELATLNYAPETSSIVCRPSALDGSVQEHTSTEVGYHSHGGDDGSGGDAASSRESRHSLCQRLTAARATLSESARRSQSAYNSLLAAKQRMVDRCTASVAKLESDAAALKAAIDAHVATITARARSELKGRVKALDAQLDGLSVCASQVSAGALLCHKAVTAASCTTRQLAAIAATVDNLSKIDTMYHGPCVSTVVAVTSDPGVGIRAIEASGCMSLTLGITHAATTQPDSTLMFDAYADNVIDLQVTDSHVKALALVADDVDVVIDSVEGVGGDVIPCSSVTVAWKSQLSSRDFSVGYRVMDSRVARFQARVLVAGAPVRDSPFTGIVKVSVASALVMLWIVVV